MVEGWQLPHSLNELRSIYVSHAIQIEGMSDNYVSIRH